MALGGFAPFPFRLGGDAQNGITPEQWLRVCADLSAARRTSPFAFLVIDQNADAPLVLSYRGQYSVDVERKPTLAFASARTTITFEREYTDGAGILGRVQLWAARGTVHGGTAGRIIVDEVTVRNKISVAPVERDGTPLPNAVFSLAVW